MNPLIHVRKATPLFFVALACFAVSPGSRAVSPPPDGGYPIRNTAEGTDALLNLTSGVSNTAIGSDQGSEPGSDHTSANITY